MGKLLSFMTSHARHVQVWSQEIIRCQIGEVGPGAPSARVLLD